MAHRRVRLRISGKVQGVFFRESAKRQALALGISGWIRNRPEGDVEAIGEGTQQAMDAFIAWCHKGPPAAQVLQVEVTEEPSSDEFSTFEIRR